MEFLLRAFLKGQDGVYIGGCKLDECNYVTHGNYDALANTYLCKRILAHIGLNPDRMRTDFMSGADGNLLAEYTDEFSSQLQEMGPLGSSEGLAPNEVRFKLTAAKKLVPYLRLVERQRLRAPEKTKQAYKAYCESDEVRALFDGILSEKLAVSQILLLLGEKPLSTSDISERLGLNSSDVSRYMITSSRHGMVRYDTRSQCYALA